MICHPHDDAELLALVRRYVTPERRYLKLGGSLLRMRSPEYDRFMRDLCEDAGLITADEIATLLEGGWRERRTAAWLVAVSRRTEFRERLGELLLASEVCCAGMAYCVALASFGTARDADLLVSLALGAYGGGSMIVTLILPRVLDRVSDRAVMLRGALLLTLVFAALGAVTAAGSGGWQWPALLFIWAAFGAACSMVLTPTGRLIRRSTPPEERTSAFAAQFSLSHSCWLLTYPLAGWLGAEAGLQSAVVALGAIALTAGLLAVRLWPTKNRLVVEHEHTNLRDGHPHLVDAVPGPNGWRHSHDYLADALHTR
ncbi:DUF6000 family protein [Streptomyces sp. NBC_01669]|uniref:DUF6000 family protein n=1 Tax=Streptomyces sp. NBC_01669 TaxID=2975909 RepID=UPI00225336FA|nr:DUF6000 family protein [Streptomyces sp. NBC_01669]MCX4537908.1 DUF6000 family protein [Streptomyces sp. NBC_01669]